jgi:hypothetical protein
MYLDIRVKFASLKQSKILLQTNVPVRSVFKFRQTVLRCEYKLDILVSKSGLHKREEDAIWLCGFLIFQNKLENYYRAGCFVDI